MSDRSEEFATVSVPDHKTVHWLRVCMVGAMVSFSLPTFITGVEVGLVSSGENAFIAIALGCLILTLIGCVTASIGAQTRLSSYMLTRVVFGTTGSILVNLAFAVSLLGWFGVNIDLFSGAVLRLFEPIQSIQPWPWAVELLAGVIMTATTLYGFKAINILSAILVPVLMVVTIMLISTAVGIKPLPQILALNADSPIPLGDAISAVVGSVIVGAVILPDITRFIKDWKGAVYTVLLAYLVVTTIVTSAGALAAIAQGSDDLLDIMILMGLGWAAFAIVILGSWVLNSLNLYSTVLSIEATVPKFNERWGTIALGFFGTIAAFLNILDYFIDFLFYLSIIFVPVAGVIAVDYFIVRKAAYHENLVGSLRRYAPLSLIAWSSGAVVALLGANGLLTITKIAALDAMFVSASVYAVSHWLVKRPEETIATNNRN